MFTDKWLTSWAVLHIAVTALVMVTALIGDSWTWMTTLAVIANGATAGLYGYLVIRRRVAAEAPDAPDADEQPESDGLALPERKPMSHWSARPFVAVCACPNCGETNVHRMREPIRPVAVWCAEGESPPLQQDIDPVDAAVIRTCAKCKQEWGEK